MQATQKQLEYLRDLLEKLGEAEATVCEEYEVEDVEALTIEQASGAIEDLKAMLH